MPTAQRAPAALLVRRGGDKLLFDCAEGTQRQLLRSSIGLIELREVFITHFHADHVLGLPGMLKTFALRGRDLPLVVYGPRGLVDLLGSLKRVGNGGLADERNLARPVRIPAASSDEHDQCRHLGKGADGGEPAGDQDLNGPSHNAGSGKAGLASR